MFDETNPEDVLRRLAIRVDTDLGLRSLSNCLDQDSPFALALGEACGVEAL